MSTFCQSGAGTHQRQQLGNTFLTCPKRPCTLLWRCPKRYRYIIARLSTCILQHISQSNSRRESSKRYETLSRLLRPRHRQYFYYQHTAPLHHNFYITHHSFVIMKFFTSLHDTLNTVTDHIQLSPQRSRRASTTTSSGRQNSAEQVPEPRVISTAKRLRKRRHSHCSSKPQNEQLVIAASSVASSALVESTAPLEEPEFQLYRLASVHFSRFDSAGTVLKASCSLPPIPKSEPLRSKPLPGLPLPAKRPTLINSSAKMVKYRHPSLYFPKSDLADDVLASLSQSHVVSLQSSLGDGMWTKGGSVDHVFLQEFMSEEALRHFADGAVPSLLARRLMETEGHQPELMPDCAQQPRLGSWKFVLEHFSPSIMERSNGTHTWIPHRILPKRQLALQQMTNDPVASDMVPSSLDIISKASVRQPTTLVLKQTFTADIDDEISFFSFSKGNHITNPLPPSFSSSPTGWSRLEGLALDCFISEDDLFRVFNDCKNTLQTAVLNLRGQSDNSITTTDAPPTQMPVLSSLTITSSVPLELLASAFAFPALQELSLTIVENVNTVESPALGILNTGQQPKLSAALQFPWSNLARLALCNSTCDTPRVQDILAQCSSLTSFTWRDQYSTEPQARPLPLSLPLLRELIIDANECGPLLRSIAKVNLQEIEKLSLRCCDHGMVMGLPDSLTDIVVQESMELGLCASVLERLKRCLIRGNVSVGPGELDPCQGPIHMTALQCIDLRGRTKPVQILRSLINAPHLHERSM